jgi:hypothetical protein
MNMGLLGTSNKQIATQITNQDQAQFKTLNNLLTLQENHVEEFFQYHGEQFLGAMEKLMEDVLARVISKMLVKMKFVTTTTGDLEMHPDALREYEAITAENIQLDLAAIMAAALNSEVIMQRRMAKAQYLESQGFSTAQQPQTIMSQTQPQNIQGSPQMGGMNQQVMMQQQAFNNQSGYPIQPAGYDSYNNPYWVDPQTGQATYTAPNSGLNLAQNVSKLASWAAWLA